VNQQRSIWMRLCALMVGVLFLVGLATPAQASPQHHFPSARCQEVSIPAKTTTRSVSIYGKLCMPVIGKPKTVQLLVHGATYNHLYWDFPGFDGKYSYSKVANDAGYATLAIDRLGTGQSTRPPSQEVTYDAQISTLHQVIQALRKNIAGKKFSSVQIIGHSFGSAYAIGEAATYQDVDAMVLTGNGHKVSTLTQQQSVDFFHPANTEARFSSLDAGYLTTIPGTRDDGGFLYDMSRTDPEVVKKDEATKDVISTAEFATRPPNLGTLALKIKVPVLIFDGQQDTHYCGLGANDCSSTKTFYDAEKPFYTTCLAVAFVKSGHDVNLHTNAPSSFRKLVGLTYFTLSPYANKARCVLQGGL